MFLFGQNHFREDAGFFYYAITHSGQQLIRGEKSAVFFLTSGPRNMIYLRLCLLLGSKLSPCNWSCKDFLFQEKILPHSPCSDIFNYFLMLSFTSNILEDLDPNSQTLSSFWQFGVYDSLAKPDDLVLLVSFWVSTHVALQDGRLPSPVCSHWLPAFLQGHFKAISSVTLCLVLSDFWSNCLHIPFCPPGGYKLSEDRRMVSYSHCFVHSIQLSASPRSSSTNTEHKCSGNRDPGFSIYYSPINSLH